MTVQQLIKALDESGIKTIGQCPGATAVDLEHGLILEDTGTRFRLHGLDPVSQEIVTIGSHKNFADAARAVRAVLAIARAESNR